MGIDEDLERVREFALASTIPNLRVLQARVEADERADGDRLLRATLLLSDPDGDTWPLESTRALRAELNKQASELGLPRITTVLVAESEPEAHDLFPRG